MIPFIIGGIALAATGYGVAKLLEDDGNCDKKSEIFSENLDSENELIEKFESAKVELYNTSFTELKTALHEIDNLNKEIPISTQEVEKSVYLIEELTDDINHSIEEFTDVLRKTKDYINSKLDSLDSIIINESNYEKYSEEDKKTVDELFNLFKLIEKVLSSKIINDDLTISRKVKRGFRKMEQLVG